MSSHQNSGSQSGTDSKSLMEWVRTVQDPELKLSLVGLGLIYDVWVEDGLAKVKMTLTSPGCPVGPQIIHEVKTRLKEHPEINEAEVQLVWDPKWNPQTMADEECKDEMGIW